ncbi:peptidase domain-containing ABC transporter [Novosphingobium sp. FKTRR1]|uniref:peptidase domain-containing ABC transporter n=1 Tax=Novosphingobium sp. FKTRR1 TaxID=2879118 RepID=UPI001CF09533|nr:ATP-binding cassette domain-containing protein [Novosphingobium sp. FKTRR1]
MNLLARDPVNEVTADIISETARIDAINATIGPACLAGSPLARCLAPLLVALDWSGAARGLSAYLPADGQPMSDSDFRYVLDSIGYSTVPRPWSEWQRIGSIDALPVGSVLVSDEAALVYLGSYGGADWWHDGEAAITYDDVSSFHSVLLVEADPAYSPLDAPQTGWLGKLLYSSRHEIIGVMVISFFANLLALTTSFYTMFIYNSIIPGGAIGSLWPMTIGAGLAILAAWGLRIARVRLLSDLTAWGGSNIGTTAFRKTFSLPIDVSARLGVDNNLIRLRSMEGVRQWFGGAGGAINADMPLLFIFLIAIAWLGGWIVLVPMFGLLIYALLAWPIAVAVKARSSEVGRVSRKFGELTTVLAKRLRAVRSVRGSALWDHQLADLLVQSVAANRDYAVINSLSQTVSQALSMFIVLATMGFGITLVLDGTMSTGGLIAAMMLIWRVTTPAQQFFASQVRLSQLRDSSRQLDRLLASAGEASNPQMTSPVLDLTPSVEADHLFYRYSADREPALSGVSFAIEPGQMLAIVGPNGAGKTTLLEMLAGVRLPQNGRVVVGGRNVRQFDPADFRAWLGYLPQEIPGLPISVAETLRLRVPASTDAEIEAALERVAGPRWWAFLGEDGAQAGLACIISPWREDRQAVRARFIVQLASAILGNPPLILLDDPQGDRDPALDEHFVRLLESLRGTSTVILATHRVDLIHLSDFVVVINDGALVHFGPVAPPAAVVND